MSKPLPKRLFGYRARDVEAHIEVMGREISSRISAAESYLRSQLDVQKDLMARAATAREELARLRQQQRAYDQAIEKARLTAEGMIEAARYRVKQLRMAAEMGLAEDRLYLANLENQISELREESKETVASLRRVIVEERPEHAEVRETGKVAGRILPVSGADSPFATKSLEGFVKIDVSMQSVMVVTPDGSEIGRVKCLVLDKTNDKIAGYEIVPQGERTFLKSPTIVPASGIVAVRDDALIVNGGWLRELRRGQPDSGYSEMAQALAGMEQPDASAARPEPLPAPLVSSPPAGGERAVVQSQDGTCVQGTGASIVGLDVRIRDQQMRCLIGRISGRDIKDSEGGLIARKGETITPEIVEKAKSAGNLAELIVYMTIPGVDMDEEAASAS